ncbi:MAG: peptidase [Thermomicrobiales bacterium]|nr:peptidase [Thermomicrobiales bacterium]
MARVQYEEHVHDHDRWLTLPGYPLEPDFPEEEYRLRIDRARRLMTEAGLDALVITSGAVGQWFTSAAEPHEWHDQCPARAAWYVLTPTDDVLYMTPTTAGEHMNTTRRSTWVTHILPIVERVEWPRVELWDLEQMPQIFTRLNLERGRLGFELGDCMTLGLSVNDFMALQTLLPQARLSDASPVIRTLMSVHTPLEIERIRKACEAGVWIHNQLPHLLQPDMTERELLAALRARFAATYAEGYTYKAEGAWDVRNKRAGDYNLFHAGPTDRPYRAGDYISRGTSGVSYRGYGGDVDRSWHLGTPAAEVLRLYQITWECNQAMAEAIKPGYRCSDIYAACATVERQHDLPERRAGRVGHGLRNTGGLSVHPDNHTVLEPNMVISVEPMFATDDGWFDLEDQYLVTATGRQILHTPATPDLPVIEA